MAATPERASDRWRVGDRVADTYEVRALLGEGGMGTVHRVRHLGWNVDLAVKSPLAAELRDESARRRFVREAETWVDFGPHPHVCTCHYVRIVDDVPRVFVEYLDAGSLREWIADGRLYQGSSTEVMTRVLDVAIQTAWGLVHAHEHGVVHQDVKPANILLDATGQVKITDFGLARAQPPIAPVDVDTDAEADDRTLRVSYGGMTRAYASPEQYSRSTVGRSSDVWSLAVTVLEMLVGDLAWRAGPAAGAVLAGYRAEGFGSRAAGVEVPAALEDLLTRCLRTDPGTRPTMTQVAADLIELYAATAASAYPRALPGPGELRADELNNRALSLLDLGRTDEAEAVLAAAGAADPQHPEAVYNRGLLQWRRSARTDQQLVGELELVRDNSPVPDRVQHLLDGVHRERGDAETEAVTRFEAERPPSVTMLPGGTHAWSPWREGEGDAVALWDLATGQRLCVLDGHTERVYDVALVAGTPRAVSCAGDGTVRVWDTETGDCLRTLTGHEAKPRAEGGTGSLSVGDSLRVSQNAPRKVRQNPSVYSIRLGPGGTTVYSAGVDRTVRQWDIETGECLRILTQRNADAPPLPDNYVSFGFVTASTNELCLTPDDRHILCTSGGLIWVWHNDTGTLRHVLSGHTNSVTAISATPDGRFALSASTDATVRVWDVMTGDTVGVLSGHGAAVSTVLVTPDGRHAVTAGGDRTARLWDLATGRCLRTIPVIARLAAVGLSADGRELLYTDDSGQVCRTAIRTGVPGAFQISRPRDIAALNQARDQVAALVTAAEAARADGDIPEALARLREARDTPGFEHATHVTEAWRRLYEHCVHTRLRTARQAAVITDFTGPVEAVAVTPDGTKVMCGTYDGTVRLLDLPDGRVVHHFGSEIAVIDAAGVSPDGSRVAVDAGSAVRVWDRETGELLHLLKHPGRIEFVRFAPDPDRLVSSDSDRVARVWNLTTGECERFFSISSGQADFHWTTIRCVTPDGRHAVVNHENQTLRLWELNGGICVRTLNGEANHVRSGCVTADGHLMLSTHDDGSVHVWDLVTGDRIRTLTGHTGTVNSVRLTSDDRYALTGGHDGTIRVWRLTTGECVRVLTGHIGGVNSVSVSPDGSRVVSGGEDKTIRVWELDWELAVRDLDDWTGELESRLGAFLVRCAETHAITPNAKPGGYSGPDGARDWTDRDFALLRGQLIASGYGAVSEADLRRELDRLLMAAVEPTSLAREPDRPPTPANEPSSADGSSPHTAAIRWARARRSGAAESFDDATRFGAAAIASWRHLAETDPDAYRHDLVAALQAQGTWLGRLRRLDEALEVNAEAIGHCRELAEFGRSSRLYTLMHNHYAYLWRAKRRTEIREWLHAFHAEFAESVYARYLPDWQRPAASRRADDPGLVNARAAANGVRRRFGELPATDPNRLPGGVVAGCAEAQLLVREGQETQADALLWKLLPEWSVWRLRTRRVHSDAALIGLDLLELTEKLNIKWPTMCLRWSLRVSKR